MGILDFTGERWAYENSSEYLGFNRITSEKMLQKPSIVKLQTSPQKILAMAKRPFRHAIMTPHILLQYRLFQIPYATTRSGIAKQNTITAIALEITPTATPFILSESNTPAPTSSSVDPHRNARRPDKKCRNATAFTIPERRYRRIGVPDSEDFLRERLRDSGIGSSSNANIFSILLIVGTSVGFRIGYTVCLGGKLVSGSSGSSFRRQFRATSSQE